MKFTKMHGCGNDYIYVNGFEENIKDEAFAAKYVSDRHFGIGGDGLIIIKPSEKADFEMVMYNADGSRGAMCGNGVRCVAKYVYDNKLTDKTTLTVESMGKIKYIDLELGDDGLVKSAKVDMGAPLLKASDIPVISDNEKVIDEEIAADEKSYKMTCVSMGNPHAVIFIDEDVKAFPLEKIGPVFENHNRFPDRINTEFARVTDRENIDMRVWERGSGETLACGTGACATVVAAILNGYTNNDVTVHLLGGDLKIHWSGKETDSVIMSGPAAAVFDGEIKIPMED